MSPRTTRGILVHAAAIAAAAILLAPPASATVSGGAAIPAEPTVCDSVRLVAHGTLPNPCYTVRGFRVSEPEPLPTMGPLPVYRLVGVIRTEEPNPELDIACPTVIEPYRVSKELGKLPFGHYVVDLVEYLHPFPADSTAPIDSSRAYAFFVVGADTCRTADGCVLFDFAKSSGDADRIDGCTARAPVGGRACFDVTLQNEVPVAAFQTTVSIPPFGGYFLYQGLIAPAEIVGTSRTPGFTVTWTQDGHHTKIVAYSTSDAVIAPGRGPVLHLCYDLKQGLPEGSYEIGFGPAVVSTPGGDAIPLCPTFREQRGRLCVGGEPGCDLNGDGVANIRDIARLAACVLGDSTACPDSVRARADCNDDASIDVRDIVCCVRNALRLDAGWGPVDNVPGLPATDGTTYGFDGPAVWTTPLEARAVFAITPGTSFGGLQFVADAGPADRIRDITLENPETGWSLAWEPRPDGTARVMIHDGGGTAGGAASTTQSGAAGTVRVVLTLERAGGGTGEGEVVLDAFVGATPSGDALFVPRAPLTADVPASPAPEVPAIFAARPNPFVSDTEISFSLPAAGRASIRLFDISGRLVRTLQDGAAVAGVHRLRWDGRDERGRSTPAGIYFAHFTSGNVVRTERILRLR